MKKIQISPSILSADFSQLANEIKRLEEGGADMIHVDVMDGHFVPNLTIGPPVIKALRKHCSLKFDVHLMISPVHKYIKDFSDAGADIITFHPEATENMEETISLIKSLEKKVGVSLNPDTENKIKSLKEIKDKNNYNFDIEVDGGVNFSNSKDILNAGANILVSGTTIFKENRGDIKKNIETLRLV